MSQSDLNIANVTRTVFRQEVNEALQALGSLSSGATEPSTTYAYQLWADTGSGLLKQRNAANDGWINKGNLADVDWGFLNKAGGSMSGLLQLDQSTNIVAAATTNLGNATGNAVTVTHASGTVAITSFGGTSLQSGAELTITWSVSGGSLSVTHNATSLILPSAANLPIADGDVWKVQKISDSLAYWRVVDVTKADGTAVVREGGVPVGVMLDFGGTDAPEGYLLCDGSNVNRTTYAALFAVIGTNFGNGNGSTTFTLPDSRRRVAVGAGGTGTSELGNTVGSTGGSETHTLSEAEMPSHTHIQNAHSHPQRLATGTISSGPNITAGTSPNALQNQNNTASATATNQNTGGGGAHNNMQPSLVVTKIIKY